MKIRLIIFCIFLVLSSCKLYFRKSHQLARDYRYLNNINFARKYFTLYDDKIQKTRSLASKRVYKMYISSFFKYLVFSKDNWVYESSTRSTDIKDYTVLKRGAFYTVEDSVIKVERIVQDMGSIYTIINEGTIRNDTIFLTKKYTSGSIVKIKRKMKNMIIPDDDFEYYYLYDDIIIFKKK